LLTDLIDGLAEREVLALLQLVLQVRVALLAQLGEVLPEQVAQLCASKRTTSQVRSVGTGRSSEGSARQSASKHEHFQ
jgi:hypothetical protein